MFYPVGHRFHYFGNTYILAQLSEVHGTFINVESGNRYSDDFVFLEIGGDGVRGTYAVPREFLANTEISVEEKPDVVEFYRYIRPRHRLSTGNKVAGEIDNLRGVTLKFVLDYPANLVWVYVAICNGDNFFKKIGRVLCGLSGKYFVFQIPDDRISFDHDSGAVNWFIRQLDDRNYDYMTSTFGFNNARDLESYRRKIVEMYGDSF